MKSRTTIKTRLLALLLTVLMTVGVLPFSIFAVGTNGADNRLETDNALFRAPTGQDVVNELGESALIYYNDFNGESIEATAMGNASFTRNNGWQKVDDGNGGYAYQTKSGQQQNTMFTIGKTHGAQIATYSGATFTFAGDFKLGAYTHQGVLFYFMSTVKTGASASVGFCSMPVWIDGSGNLYNGQITSTVTGSTSKKTLDCGTTWTTNDIGVESATFATADKKIGQLSADAFTNIAVTVDVAKNVYAIYIDGDCVANNQTFICQSMLDYYAECDAAYGGVELGNGYAISGVCLGYRNASNVKGDSYIFDNWIAYLADKPLGANGFEYDSSLTAEDFKVSSSLINNAYKSESKYWKKQAIHGIDDIKDKVYVTGSFYRRSIIEGATTSPDVEADYKGAWEKGYAGADMALTFELQAKDDSGSGVMQIRTNPYKGGQVWGQKFLQLKKNGTAYELWVVSDGNATGFKVADIPNISSGKFIKVDVLFDNGGVLGSGFEQTKFYVFVDGKYVGSENWSSSTVMNGQYNYQKEWAAAGGDHPMGIIFGALALKEGWSGGEYNIKNVGVYYYDDNADGDVADSARKINLSVPTLKHYQDFNALAVGNLSAKPGSLLGGNITASYKTGVAVVDDGRGGKALTTNASGDIYYEVYSNAASGTNFVTSMDIKLTKMPTEKLCLFNGCAYNANAGSYGRDFNIAMLYLSTDGGVYLARKTDATSEGVLVNHYTDATPYLTEKLCSLNTTDYTNLAVAVNVFENTITVYVNGVAVVEDIQFLTDSDYELLKSTANFSNGFGLTHRRFAIRGYMLVDNIAVYYSNDILASKVNTDPRNGYVKDGSKYYYYDNGCIASNFTSADGLLSAGLDGVVTYGGTALTSIRAIYKYVGIDVVPVDGVMSGVYSYTKSGAYYCYGVDKILMKDQVVDMGEVISGFDLTKPCGFSISASGAATALNGFVTLDNGHSYYYVNGIRTKGFVTTDSGVFFVNDDYTLFAGQKTIDGKTYLFDVTTNKGALLNGVYTDVEDANTPDRYYVDGVAQKGLITTDETKYFADANGVLKTGICLDPVSGNNYYFYPGGANKYEMAVGVSVVWNGSIVSIGADGIIDGISGKVYGEWTEVEGIWYYSDASGNLQTGLAYIEKAPDDTKGGYYYFDNDGLMVKDTFVDVYGTTIYFGKDGIAPNGVVFVEYTATNFPARPIVYGVHGVDGEYLHFINGVAPVGKTEAIQDGFKYSFENGILVAREELDANNPEVLITIFKDGFKDSFYFNTNASGTYSMLLTEYPCYVITVYNVTDPDNKVKLTPDEQGRYTLVATNEYDVRYDSIDHTFDTTPVNTVNPTCGKDGYHEYKCTVDGCIATKREVIAATGEHTYPDAPTQIIELPTCVQMGLGIAWCTECGNAAKDYDIAINPDAHAYGAWDTKYEATCVKDGLKSRECDLCGKYDREILPATGAHVKGTLVTVDATCVTEGSNTWNCANPDCEYKFVEIIPIDYNNHAHGNANGTLDSYDEPEVAYFERFQVTKISTCLENGHATYRCKDCGGFIYEVTIELDPDNHHFAPGADYSNNGNEYLAVLNADGNVIERVEIVNGEVLVNGTKVADVDASKTARENILANSDMICGFAEYAEWRIDCQNGCINPDDPATDVANDAIVWYTVVEEVEGNFMHKFDLSTLYTTTDKNDPLYGMHYYLCEQCGKAAGAVAHDAVYTENGDGTHTVTCADGCVLEGATNPAYSEVFDCEFVTNYDNDSHWLECKHCGFVKDDTAHTLTDSDDGLYHYRDCDCGYQEKHHMSAICHKEATCCEPGYTDYMDCDDCDYISGKVDIEMIAHDFDGVWTSDASGHWYACSNTCNGVQCTFKYMFQAHNYVDVDAVAPGCESVGHDAYKVCTECGYKDGFNELSALDHDVVGQPYDYDDVNHWQSCSRCNKRIVGPHSLGIVVDDEEGTKECSVCHARISKDELTWWYQLELDRVTVDVSGTSYYRYTYGDTKDAIVKLNDGNLYYFDENGYLVLTGDTGVNNGNAKAANGTFDTVSYMGNTRGILLDAILTTSDGYTYAIKNGEYLDGWQQLADAKDYFFNTKLDNNLVVADAPEFALIKGTATITALNYAGTAVTTVNVDANGARLLGVVDNGDGTASYYLDGTAGKLTGRIEDNYYKVGNIYFAKADGTLYAGAWQNVNGVYYSFDDVDYNMTAWHTNATTTLDIEGTPTIIYTDGEGKRIITGWYLTQGVGGRRIENGEMLVDKDSILIDGTYYVIDVYGVVSYYNGWIDDNHYVASGIVVTDRFEEIGGNKYYFDGDGELVKATPGATVKVVIGSWVYEIDENGVATQYSGAADWVWFINAETGKVSTSAKGYYTSTGLIVDQAIVIGEFTYIFDENGVLVTSEENYECNGYYYIIDAEGKATLKDEEDGE